MESEGRRRVSPLQPRGKQSVGKMLDATGELIDELGYEHLTTQQVARRSGVSIGLVYHYFPDRLALVEALIARNSERFMAAVMERLDGDDVTTWRDALKAILNALSEMYRREPGFGKIGLNDRFLTAQSAPVIPDQDNLAGAFLTIFRERYAPRGPEPPDLQLRFEIAVQMGDAFMARAFRYDQSGEARVLAEARTVLENYLAPFLDVPSGSEKSDLRAVHAQSGSPEADESDPPTSPGAADNTSSGKASKGDTGRGDDSNGGIIRGEGGFLDPAGGH